MKHKRLMAILLALAMMITFMPAMAFAEDNEASVDETANVMDDKSSSEEDISERSVEKKDVTLQNKEFPAPTNLQWDAKYPYDATFRWDYSSYESDLAGFHVNAVWEKGTETDKDVGGPAYKHSDVISKGFSKFMKEKGEGLYSFYTYAVAYDGSGYDNDNQSKTVISEKTQFYKVNLSIVTQDSSGSTIQKEGGSIDFVYGGNPDETQNYSENEVFVYPENSKMSFEAKANIGYDFVGFSYDNNVTPADSSNTDNKISFTLDKSVGVKAVFKRNDSVSLVNVEFGNNHKSVAESVANAINTDTSSDAEATVEGSVLHVGFPKTGAKEYNAMDYVSDAIQDVLGIHGYIDSGEKIASYYSVGKENTSGYASDQEIYNEWETAKGVDLGDTLVLYVLWAKPATTGVFTVNKPVCGTAVKLEKINMSESPVEPIGGGGGLPSDDPPEIAYYKQTPVPVVKTEKDSQIEAYQANEESFLPDASRWVKDKNISGYWDLYLKDKLYEGPIVGGTKYTAVFLATIKFGYYFNEDKPPVVYVNGEKAEYHQDNRFDSTQAFVIADIKAEHDWGAWTVTRKPTTKREGEETRTCKHCGAKETRPIPKKAKSSNSPKTADESYPVLWIAVMLMAMAMLACTVTVRIRQRRRRSE